MTKENMFRSLESVGCSWFSAGEDLPEFFGGYKAGYSVRDFHSQWSDPPISFGGKRR